MLQTNPWELIRSLQSVIISSVLNDNVPHTSYAPFIEHEESFYIFTSMMATHTKTLLQNQTVSLLFIEDESKSHNIFARKRVTFHADVTAIERESIVYNGTITLFEDKFGDMANIYKTMKDFQLFKLIPVRGRAVFGFGQAYDFKEGSFQNINVGMK